MKKINFTEQQKQEMIEYYTQGVSGQKISEMYSISYNTFRRMIKERNIPVHSHSFYNKKFHTEFINQVLEFYKNGVTIKKIAKDMNTSQQSISRILKESGLKIDSKVRLRKLSPSEEKEIVKLYLKGKTQQEIGKKFNAEPVTIARVLKRNNIETRFVGKKKIFEEQEKEVITLYESNSAKKISKLTNLSVASIVKILKKNGVYNPKPNNSNYKAPLKLSSDKHPEIINLYKQGHTVNKIAEEFNVSSQTIRRLLTSNNIQIRDSKFYLRKIYPKDISDIIKSYENGISITLLSKKYGVNFSTISTLLKNNDVKLRPQAENLKKLSITQEKEVIELYNKEISQETIADKFNVSRDTISKILKRNNVKLRPVGHHVTKLNDKDKKEIIRLYQEGLNMAQVGEVIGVTTSTIGYVLRANKIKTRQIVIRKPKDENS